MDNLSCIVLLLHHAAIRRNLFVMKHSVWRELKLTDERIADESWTHKLLSRETSYESITSRCSGVEHVDFSFLVWSIDQFFQIAL